MDCTTLYHWVRYPNCVLLVFADIHPSVIRIILVFIKTSKYSSYNIARTCTADIIYADYYVREYLTNESPSQIRFVSTFPFHVWILMRRMVSLVGLAVYKC